MHSWTVYGSTPGAVIARREAVVVAAGQRLPAAGLPR